ncbi:MAG: nuclear transport factor 2 family protein, partial [Rhodospirillaceae bacterium]
MNFTGPVEDRIAIRELCDQYCSGVMSKDAAMWSETWAEDAEWIHTGISTKGKAAIVAESSKIMDSYSAGAFFSNLGSTHITGHRATGRCHQFELFFFANGPAWFLS